MGLFGCVLPLWPVSPETRCVCGSPISIKASVVERQTVTNSEPMSSEFEIYRRFTGNMVWVSSSQSTRSLETWCGHCVSGSIGNSAVSSGSESFHRKASEFTGKPVSSSEIRCECERHTHVFHRKRGVGWPLARDKPVLLGELSIEGSISAKSRVDAGSHPSRRVR